MSSNVLRPGKLKKQPFEEWVIAADFTQNMNLAAEDLVLESCSVEAIDVNGNDATENGDLNAAAQIVDTTTMTIGTGAEKGYLKILCKGGLENETVNDPELGEVVEDRSPYKITFKGITDAPEKWEKVVIVTVRDMYNGG